MTKRRTHSTVDRLPAALREELLRMVVDGTWPADCSAQRKGKPRYEDIIAYCHLKGYALSHSALGRWAKGKLALALLKDRSEIVRTAMSDCLSEDASSAQRAIAELISARTLDLVLSDETLSARQIKDLATAGRDNAAVILKADQYRQAELEKKAKLAAASTKKKLTAAGVNRKLIQEIIDDHLGVTKT